MKYTINDSQLHSVFNTVMGDFNLLESTERCYDSWVYEKNRYVDLCVINYYKNIDEDWEDDQWIIQYQDTPGDIGTPDEVPLLRYSEYYFRNPINMFGVELFQYLLKHWFENTFGKNLKTVMPEES